MYRINLHFVGIAFMLLISLFLFIPVAQAGEQSLDTTLCNIGEAILLHGSKEVTILALDYKGIHRSNIENKVWDNFTQKCVGVLRIEAGKSWGNGYCKSQNLQGDFALLEYTNSGKPGEGTWKFLQGIGKLEGIRGGGKYYPVTKTKPIEKGTFQNCYRVTGTSELPKPK